MKNRDEERGRRGWRTSETIGAWKFRRQKKERGNPNVFSRMKQRVASPRQLEQERRNSVSRGEIDSTISANAWRTLPALSFFLD